MIRIVLPTMEPKMRLPIHLDLAEVFDLAPDVARLIGLLIKAKSKRSDGGKSITEGERAELQDALEEALGEIITAGQD